jgi:hypothetical protein
MKFAAGILILLIIPPVVSFARVTQPATTSTVTSICAPSLPSIRPSQEWLGEPVLPAFFHIGEERVETTEGAESDIEASQIVSLEIPPLLVLTSSAWQEPPPSRFPESQDQESTFPRGITALDIQAWREKDDLRRIREWAGDALFGLPLFVPQLLVETLIPRGIPVGPTTFLYNKSTTGSSLALVVFDQVLFHEAQFLAQAQAYGSNGPYGSDLNRSQRHVLRQSVMSGFRATYAMPRLTMGLVLETMREQGALGYALAAPIGGALLYLKGIDEKFHIDDTVHCRFKIASGRQWVRGTRSTDGIPALSFELRFCDFPVGIIGSFDVSNHGMFPAFIGVGTSLDAVEVVLGLNAQGSSQTILLR